MTSGTRVFLADELTCAVAATGLPGSPDVLATRPLDDAAWSDLLGQARFHKMVGLMAAAVQKGSLPATEPQRAAVHDAHARGMELCLQLEQDLVHIGGRFEAANVDIRVLKGPSFAHLDYADPVLRAFGDIDILVRSEQYDDAVGVLRAAGFERGHQEIRRGFDRRFGKGANFTGPNQQRSIDLHRTFVMGPFGLMVELSDLWERGDSFEVGGRTFGALAPELRFLHACFHSALGNARTRLVPLRDVAEMLLRPHRPVDVDQALALSRRWRAEVVVMRAVDLAWEALGLPENGLSRSAAEWTPTHREDQALRTYLDPDMGFAARCFEAIRALDRPRDKAAFAAALAFPARTYGAGRHGSRRARWGRAIRQIGHLARPGRRR